MDTYLLLVEEGSDETLGVNELGNWCVENFCPPVRPRSASPTKKRRSPSKEESPGKKPRNGAAVSQHAQAPINFLSPQAT